MAPPAATSHDADDATSSSDISIDSTVAFAFADFSGVDFGGNDGPDADAKAVPDPPCAERRDKLKLKTSRQRGIEVERPLEMPDGQQPLEERRDHDPELFEAQNRRVQNLCKWHELGIRPDLSPSRPLDVAAHRGKDDDLFASATDDLRTLLLRSVEAQDELNANLPPHPRGEYEDCLRVAPSTIANAGRGLFATSPMPEGAVVCHYSGYRHHYQSQKRLRNRAYVLKLQNGWPKHDRRNDGFVDGLPTEDVVGRFINDPRIEERCNVKFQHIQEPGIWHCPVVALRDIDAGEELFISYGPHYWSESRMIGG